MSGAISLDRDRVINSLLFILISIQLLMRPSLLQGYGFIIFPLSILLMASLLVTKKIFQITSDRILFLVFTFFFVIFLLIQNLFSNDGISIIVLNSASSILAPVLLVFFIDQSNWRSAMKAVIYPVILLSISYLITFLMVLSGIQISDLQLYSFELTKDIGVYNVEIYFPFSISLGYDFPGLNIRIARAIGYFREPGIFSPIVAFSFFGVDYLKIKYKGALKILLLFTLFLTFSTAGFVTFIIAFIYYYFISITYGLNRIGTSYIFRFFILIIFVPFFYLAVFGDYRFGLISKLSQNSGQERIISISESLNILQSSPLFGVGYPNSEVSGVTFLSTLGQIGIVGGLLFLLIFTIPFINIIKRRDPILSLLIPLFTVSLLSQPLFDKSLLFLIATIVICAPKMKHSDEKENSIHTARL